MCIPILCVSFLLNQNFIHLPLSCFSHYRKWGIVWCYLPSLYLNLLSLHWNYHWKHLSWSLCSVGFYKTLSKPHSSKCEWWMGLFTNCCEQRCEGEPGWAREGEIEIERVSSKYLNSITKQNHQSWAERSTHSHRSYGRLMTILIDK